jgi:hypothetical protein
MLFEPARHEPWLDVEWDEARARQAIRSIVTAQVEGIVPTGLPASAPRARGAMGITEAAELEVAAGPHENSGGDAAHGAKVTENCDRSAAGVSQADPRQAHCRMNDWSPPDARRMMAGRGP